jgi:hypothetical protein
MLLAISKYKKFGESGPLHYPGFFLPGADELRAGRGDSCLPIKGRQGTESL